MQERFIIDGSLRQLDLDSRTGRLTTAEGTIDVYFSEKIKIEEIKTIFKSKMCKLYGLVGTKKHEFIVEFIGEKNEENTSTNK